MKTYKREIASVSMALHWVLVGVVCWFAYEDNPQLDSLIDLTVGLALWVYGFAAGAFGLDSLAKQVMARDKE